MKTTIGNCLAILAMVGMAIPTQVIADVNARDTRVSVTDIQLTPSGDFVGAVIDDKGAVLANKPVQVLYGSKVIAEVSTDANGRYSIEGLRSGMHLVKTVNNQQVCRFWDANTAPPAARHGLLLTSSDTIIRGQSCGSGCGEDCTWNGCGEDCDGCGEGCGRGRGCRRGRGGGGGGLMGGVTPGTLLMMGAFAAVSVVTVTSATQDDNAGVVAGANGNGNGGPASP